MTAASESHRITFDLTANDVVAPSVFLGTKTANDRRWMGRIIMFAGSISATMICLLAADALSTRTVAAAATMTAVFVMMYTSLLWPRAGVAARRYAVRQARFPGRDFKRTVTLEPDGLRWESDLSDQLFRWAAFTRLIVTDSHLLLLTSQPAAIVIPRRAFGSVTAFDVFTAMVRNRVMIPLDQPPSGGFPVLPLANSDNDN
jgi:hypothetical protein